MGAFFRVSSFFFVIIVISCAVSVPAWLHQIPDDQLYYYAVGVSGPTRIVKNAWGQAISRARAELAKTIHSEIVSRDLLMSTTKSGTSFGQFINILSVVRLAGVEVVERWHDRSGKYGPSDHYYVLVRMKKSEAVKQIKDLK